MFNADVQRFQANVDSATGSVTKQSQAVASAKNKILEWRDMQVKAAKDAGASTEEFEAIYSRAATMIAATSDQTATRVIRNLNSISEKQKRVAEAMQQLGAIPKGVAESEPISARSAASAAIQFGEGHQGIRSIENFVARIPGVSSALQTLFPILGSAGLLGLVVHLGDEAYEAFKKMQDLPNAIARGFENVADPMRLQLDTLRKTNDELEISVANLEHKPANTLALALDEVRMNADKAAESARKAAVEVQALLKENKPGVSDLLMGTGNTKEIATEINKRMSDRAALERTAREAIRKASSATEAQYLQGEYNNQLDAKDRDNLKYIQDTRAKINGMTDGYGFAGFNKDGTKVPYSKIFGDQTDNNNILNGFEDITQLRRDTQGQQDRNARDEEQKKQLENRNKLAHAAAEAQRKAIELQRQGWQQEDDAIKQAGGDIAAQLTYAWQTLIEALTKSAGNYAYAQNQLTEHMVAMRHEDTEAQKKASEHAQQLQRESWDADHDAWVSAAKRTAADEQLYWWVKSSEGLAGSKNLDYALRREAEATKQWQNEMEQADKARNRAALASAEQNAKLSEASVNLDLATGRISKHDAALKMATIHAELFRKQIADLNDELARQMAFDPASKDTVDAQATVDRAVAARRIQVMQDSANVASTTWLDALKNTNQLWIQDSKDTAKQVTEIYTLALNGLNQNLADLMVGDKSNFSGLFKGIGKTLAQDSLKHLEAPVLSMFGAGKADGSDQNPFSVKIVGAGGAFGLGKLSGMNDSWGMLSGGEDDDDSDSTSSKSSKSSGVLGSLISFGAALFGGHKALGGNVKAGVTYDVGEMGREEFTPDTDGHITPNNQINKGAAYYTVNVANGVTPEQMKVHVQTALTQFHPHVVSSSVAAMRDVQARRPASSR